MTHDAQRSFETAWSDGRVADLRDALAGWYHAGHRKLPWREDISPYRVWLSEIMCQQTQVATVIPYFHRFLSAFPTVTDLAAADEQDVLALWAGLGYYRRCRNLHAAAKVVANELGGVFPGSAAELLALPGVGRYTAAAIASIAFGEVAAVLDGNVKRVLARLDAEDTPVNTGPGERLQWALAEKLVSRDDPASHNQAMMELGAVVCKPGTPDCPRCPVSDVCAAFAAGTPDQYPVKKKKKKAVAVRGVAAVCVDDDGRILLARRPDDVLLGGLWEAPGGPVDGSTAKDSGGGEDDGAGRAALTQHLSERLGIRDAPGAYLGAVTHVFSHRRLTLDVYQLRATKGSSRDPLSFYTAASWFDASALGSQHAPLSRLTEKVLELASDVQVWP